MTLAAMEPDRFQKLCQALLVAEHPGVRCFPVGQADGGRDALRGDVVYQVKSARDPSLFNDHAKWIISAIDGELPALERLVERGAGSYVLMTNVGGTARLDRGTIDRVEKHLAEVVPIPAVCWWRDDLERRLEVHSHLRWQYPELLSGLDVLQELVKSDLTQHRQRRERTLRLFLERQAHLDSLLRFKQTDLQGSLFGLFVDVECTLRLRHGGTPSAAQEGLLDRNDISWPRPEPRTRTMLLGTRSGRERPVPVPQLGSADLLLTVLPRESARIVLEGAPGQGKSTLSQYLCQVHRLRLLQRDDLLKSVPSGHRTSPIRLPFRVDLRDLATWLQGENPFSAERGYLPPGVHSLDTFLAELVSQSAGGAEFTVDDLYAVIEDHDIVVVLDGLDEVANIDARGGVVDAVKTTIDRLAAICRTVQAVVTSRPAAFANSPGFPEDQFIYLTLAALPMNLITLYAEHWVEAKRLEPRHGAEVRATLIQKLSEPHIRDLARNPMQLAILLSLISTRGTSLPDKRTAIYEAYMDVFFSREAEKDEDVRRHRDLLIELHGYVAWHLHTSVEQDSSRGNIAQDRLVQLVKEYLQREGREATLAEALFRGAVERVVALVSRVEGTYEFEVQPLREYFCARHLYLTAPLSRVGLIESGSKPDRFDVIARRPYWLNVTRFYAGCYSKGELGGLADALEALWRDEKLSSTDHPRVLTTLLLSDYVFSQSAPATGRVLRVLLDGLGSRHAVATEDLFDASATLPEQSGRDELRSACLSLLARKELAQDRLARIASIAMANGPAEETAHEWLRISNEAAPSALDHWFKVGSRLGIFCHLTDEQLAPMVTENYVQRIAALVGAGDNRHYERTSSVKAVAVREALALRTKVPTVTANSGSIDALVGLLYQLQVAWRHHGFEDDFVGGRLWSTPFAVTGETSSSPPWLDDRSELSRACREVVALLEDPTVRWAESARPWDQVITAVEDIHGPVPATFTLSLLAAQAVGTTADDVCSRSLSLALELFSHKRRGAGWRRGLGEEGRLLAIAAYFLFGPPSVLLTLRKEVQRHLEELSDDDYRSVRAVVIRGRVWHRRTRVIGTATLDKLVSPSARYVALMDYRLSEPGLLRWLASSRRLVRTSPEVQAIEQRARMHVELDACATWAEALPVVARAYAERGEVGQHASAVLRKRLPFSVAEKVMAAVERYPLWLVEQCEARLRTRVASALPPVGGVAEREGWFSSSL
jgi:hypothetical protein